LPFRSHQPIAVARSKFFRLGGLQIRRRAGEVLRGQRGQSLLPFAAAALAQQTRPERLVEHLLRFARLPRLQRERAISVTFSALVKLPVASLTRIRSSAWRSQTALVGADEFSRS
jgi:hypothetical protein